MMKPAKIFFFVSTFVLVAVIGLVWLIAVRETLRKDVVLEYEAFQASTSLMDEYRRGSTLSPNVDKNILGFGLYSLDGSSIQLFGSAPTTIKVPANLFSGKGGQRPNGLPGGISSKISSGDKSIQLLRFAGMQSSFMGMEEGQMMRSGMGQGMGLGFGRRGQGQSDQAQGGGGALSASISAIPYFTWIEYNAAGYLRDKLLWMLMATAVTFVLITLYIVLMFVLRHDEELEAKQAETRELVQLGEAARTLVHEIKNPLGIMRVQTARIRRIGSNSRGSPGSPAENDEDNHGEIKATPMEEQLVDASRILDGEIVRLAGLADRIREFLKAGEGSPQNLDLVTFLESFIQRYSGEAHDGCHIRTDIPKLQEGAYVRIDKERLTLALDNLVNNAIAAVSRKSEGEKNVSIRLFERGAQWVIAVKDTGPGIPAENRQRLFEPFFTTKEKGSGIGLALAKRIVESSGGTIALESPPGEGALFTITLQSVAGNRN
jgi:signal transduction histidine kinase